MRFKAREVLDDCRFTLSLLEEEEDLRKWRILWAAAVALIRAVGHVLHKVDGEDLILKKIADDFFKKWKTDDEHAIFREFIEHERNNLLKEYVSDVKPAFLPIDINANLSSILPPYCLRKPLLRLDWINPFSS